MRGFLTIVVCAVVWLPSIAAADEPERLRYAGIPVDFAFWEPKSPTFTYADLDVSPQRREELRAQAVPALERLFRVHIRQLADGSIEETKSFARIYLTQSGVAEYGNSDFWVDASSQSATIEQAYVLLPSGRRVDADPNAVQLVADSTDNIFTDSFRVVVPLSGLEPGAISVLVVKIRQEAGARRVPWSRFYYPQWFAPLEEFDLLLSWHESGEAPQWQSDYAGLDCRPEGERAVHCRANDIPPYPSDPDIRYMDELPSFVVAENVTWDGLAQQVRALVNSAISGDRNLQQTLDGLLEGVTQDTERLDRIHQFVSQKIRYVGLEQGIGDVVPRPTGLTLDRRFGDCKDKTTLFIDLARRAGFEVYPVLTSTKRSDPAKLLIPSAGYFDHMVACVAMSASKEFCVDLTDPYSPYDSLSHFVQGAVRLDLTESPPLPAALPVTPYYRTKNVKTVNQIMHDGSLEERQTRTYANQIAVNLRATLQPMSRSERQQWALEAYHETVSDMVDPEFEFDGIDDVRSPIEIRSVAQYPSIFDIESGLYVEFEPELMSSPPNIKSGNTVHEYLFAGINYSGESIYQLPSDRIVLYTGPFLNFETPFGTLRREYKVSDDEVRVYTELSVPRANIAVSDIPNFNRFMTYITDSAKIWFATESTAEQR